VRFTSSAHLQAANSGSEWWLGRAACLSGQPGRPGGRRLPPARRLRRSAKLSTVTF